MKTSSLALLLFIEIQKIVCQCPVCLDIALVVDGSSSIGQDAWYGQVIPFLEDFAASSNWNISAAEDGHKVGLVTFASDAQLEWNWVAIQSSDSEAYSTAISDLTLLNGLTNTGAALKIAREQILEGPGNRMSCADVCIVMTDGDVTRNEALFDSELEPFREACDRVIAVGITTSVPPELLSSISSAADSVIHVTDFQGLVTAFNLIEQMICSSCPSCLDISVILDKSSSIGTRTWNADVIPFMTKFATTSRWTVGNGEGHNQISVITFSTRAKLEWNWGDEETLDANKLQQALNILRYSRGLTFTGRALQLAVESVLGAPNDRPECDNSCIVITDGDVSGPNRRQFSDMVDQYRGLCDKVIAVGVNLASFETLSGIASSLQLFDNVLQFDSYSTLEDSFDEIADLMCLKDPDAEASTGTTTPFTDSCADIGCCPGENDMCFTTTGCGCDESCVAKEDCCNDYEDMCVSVNA